MPSSLVDQIVKGKQKVNELRTEISTVLKDKNDNLKGLYTMVENEVPSIRPLPKPKRTLKGKHLASFITLLFNSNIYLL